MKTKIFISLNIPDKTKKNLFTATAKWQDLPVKWVREQNLHITLAFLGFVDESALADICEKVGAAAEKSAVFDIDFSQISLFPSTSEPRMIALMGEASDELKNLVNDLEEELGLAESKKKTYRPHIILGRIRKHKWEALDPKPEIEEKFMVNITADAVNIVASRFGEGKNKYSIIESCLLN